VRVLRTIPRTVFYPVPNVDSVLVGLRRRDEPDTEAGVSPALRALVSGSFAHRRKTLVGALALSGGAAGRSREQVRAALSELGLATDVRAERLSPQDFRALAAALVL
jgi:16S rRNA (adenine1518-N6/adenine1519-N6)-dimethyltransferase